MEKLLALAQAGATVIFEGGVPKDVPGLANFEQRRGDLSQLTRMFKLPDESVGKQFRIASVGKGQVLVGELEACLTAAHTPREALVDSGLSFIRRRSDDNPTYFIANRGEKTFEGWLPVARAGKSVVLMDPLSGAAGIGALDRGRADLAGKDASAPSVFLQLKPGESIIARLLPDSKPQGTLWSYWQSDATQPSTINGNWKLEFLSGGPTLPSPLQTANLISWTSLGGEDAQAFAGTVRYTVTFDAPVGPVPSPGEWLLSLGGVCQSARVRLNGKALGTLITPPFQIATGPLKPKGNILEVEVSNTSANRIRDLDRRGVKWKNFRDINFVNLNYKPFDASSWPLADSGLLGPVTLTPLKPREMAAHAR